MPEDQQQQKETCPSTSQASDRQAAVAALEKALQLEPRAADQWCRLGELYDTLACEASDQHMANVYRDKAVAALTQAIGLSPGLAKAHYALAGVYQAQDPCLALVELEAAAKCDPPVYGGALARAQKAVRDCTYRLAELSFVNATPEQAEPAAEILQAEFYFDDRPLRCAVLHSCVSEGARQTAKFWLFEAAEPDFARERPVAQIAVSSIGNVFLSRGCPANYQQQMTIPVVVSPQRMQRGRSIVLPVGLMVVVFGGSLFAYFNLIAPARNTANERTSTATGSAKAIEVSSKAISDSAKPAAVPPPEPTPAMVAAALPRLASGDPPKLEPAVQPAQPQPRTSRPRADAPPALSAKARATASIVSREVAVAQRAKPVEPALASTARPSAPIAIPPEAPVGSAATASRIVELKPLLKEQPTAAPTVQQEPIAVAPAPSNERLAIARAAPQEQARVARSVVKEEPAVTPSPAKEPSAAHSSWTTRMRADLAACGRPGFWRNDICRETTRWNYCHPNRWGTVRECVVDRFASSGSPE